MRPQMSRIPTGSHHPIVYKPVRRNTSRRNHTHQGDTVTDIDNAKGSIKEGAGKLTGNKDLEAEGKSDQLKAKVEDAVDDVKDAVGGLKDKLTGK